MIRSLLLAALLVAAPAYAGGPPPSIDDLDGATFLLRISGVEYDLAGATFKTNFTIETTLTKTGPNGVSLSTVLGGMSGDAAYVAGFLLNSVSGEFGSLLNLTVSGTPGKLKLKGTYTVFDPPPDFQVLRVLKISGSQIPTPK